MSEFFKQLIAQLSAIWQKLSLQQKIITVSLVAFTLLGMIGLLMWSQTGGKKEAGFKVLYSDLEVERAADVTEALQKLITNTSWRIMAGLCWSRQSIFMKSDESCQGGFAWKYRLGYELLIKPTWE